MAKSAAEKQKAYRDRKRNAQGSEKVTRVTNNDDGNVTRVMTETDFQERPLVTKVDAPFDRSQLIKNYGQPDCECRHCQQNRTNGNRHVINHGPYKQFHQLRADEVNRVSLPGDQDYDGICTPGW